MRLCNFGGRLCNFEGRHYTFKGSLAGCFAIWRHDWLFSSLLKFFLIEGLPALYFLSMADWWLEWLKMRKRRKELGTLITLVLECFLIWMDTSYFWSHALTPFNEKNKADKIFDEKITNCQYHNVLTDLRWSQKVIKKKLNWRVSSNLRAISHPWWW